MENTDKEIADSITIKRFTDGTLQVSARTPDAVTAFGLLAYGTWQINEQLNEQMRLINEAEQD